MRAFFTLLLATIFLVGIAYGQPGTLDENFGNQGFVSANNLGYHFAVVQQPDGKLLTAGGYDETGALAGRFLQEGTLDSTFGNNGFAVFEIHSSEAYDMVLQLGGKLLVVGSYLDKNEAEFSFVARFTADGILDSSFGLYGITVIPDFGDNSSYTKIALETDGSIIISGAGSAVGSQSTLPQYSLLCQLSANGKFDYSFGSGGRALISGNAIIQIHKTGLAIQKDGKILQAGYNYLASEGGQKDYVLSRYNRDGSLDNSFGTNGTVTTAGVDGLIAADFPCGIIVQPDGKIVMGGTSPGYNYITYMAALRYNTDGTLDNSFGKGGRALASFPGYTPTASAILLQPDGRLILTGQAVQQFVSSNFALCRLNTDGSPDTSFGISGRQVTPYPGSVNVFGYCATLQRDGKIVIGGSYYNNERGYESYLMSRFNGDKGQPSLIARVKRFLHNHGIGWQGLNGWNISYYSIQYSQTGKGFIEKGRISGAGSSPLRQYDYNVSEGGYYRVMAVDNKGYKTFSNQVMITDADVSAAASVYPNPARSYVTVQGLKTGETANISITDGAGNVKSRGVSNGTQYQ